MTSSLQGVRKEMYFRRESSSGESGGAVFPRTEAVAAFHCAARHALYYTHHTEMHDTHNTHGTAPHRTAARCSTRGLPWLSNSSQKPVEGNSRGAGAHSAVELREGNLRAGRNTTVRRDVESDV